MNGDAASRYEVILFDLGGVLADLGEPSKSMGLSLSNTEFWRIWLDSSSVALFETGRLSVSEFIPRIAIELGASEPEAFEGRFRNWRLKLFDGAEQLLLNSIGDASLCLMSNTNPVHWEQVSLSTDMFDQFSRLFLSFENGLYKPDSRAFEYVLQNLQCAPGKILFLDDSQENVTSARRLGIQALQVRGIDELRDVLRDMR